MMVMCVLKRNWWNLKWSFPKVFIYLKKKKIWRSRLDECVILKCKDVSSLLSSLI